MPSSVTLTFRGGKSLTKKTELLLTFDKQTMEEIYSTYNPVVWRLTSFPAGGGGSFKATYTADPAFTRAQIDDGIVQAASYSTHINVQEQTTLTVLDPTPPETYGFSKPVPFPGAKAGQFECKNETGAYQNIGVGFYQEDRQDPTTCLVLNAVTSRSSATAEFTPTVSAYVVTGFLKNQVIKGQIQSSLDWSLDLAKPNIPLYWRLEESDQGYTLVEDHMIF